MAKPLIVNSVAAEKYKAFEIEASKMYMKKFPGQIYMHTPKTEAAEIDAVLTRGNEIAQVIEFKSRELDMATLFGEFRGEWLITHDKILRSMHIAKSMRVGLTLFLYCIYDKTLLIQPIADREGLLLVEYKVKATETFKDSQKKETKIENNAFINMRKAKFIM